MTYVLLGWLIAVGSHAAEGQAPCEESPEYRRAIELLESAPLIDGHNDLPWQYRTRVGNRLDAIDFVAGTSNLNPAIHTDLPRLRAGRVGGQFWSVYVSTDFSGDEAVRVQLEQIDIARRLIDRHEALEFVTTADGIDRAFGQGRIASLLGMEGGHTLNNSLAMLRMYHALGVRYLTLTHWQSNDIADAATDAARHGGLSDFGREVIGEMNRLGMLVDLSHTHDLTMHDVLDISEAPVIFSHSSARGVTAHVRNVPDDVLDRLSGNGGIVMVTFVPAFVNDDVRQRSAREQGEKNRLERLYPGDVESVNAGWQAWLAAHPKPVARVADVADHIDYIRERIGIEYIGIGGDYDGIATLTKGLEDVSTYPVLFAELIRRGYGDDEIIAIAGGNILRVMRQAELLTQPAIGNRAP